MRTKDNFIYSDEDYIKVRRETAKRHRELVKFLKYHRCTNCGLFRMFRVDKDIVYCYSCGIANKYVVETKATKGAPRRGVSLEPYKLRINKERVERQLRGER